MPRLFYKDLKAHEKAYRDVRADEAVNDLILGSKVNKLRNLETDREKAIDTVAKNYGDFLKSLKVKNLELVNRANNAEKALDDTLQQVFDIEAKKKVDKAAKAAKAAKSFDSNPLMPGKRARSNTISSEAPTEFSEAPSTIPPYNKDLSDALTLVERLRQSNAIPGALGDILGKEGMDEIASILRRNKAVMNSSKATGEMHLAKKDEYKAAIRLYFANKSKRK